MAPTNASSTSSPSAIAWPISACPTPPTQPPSSTTTTAPSIGPKTSRVTNKGIKHFNLKENKVREVRASGDAAVTHISGEINSSDIFTKEMKDAAHFRRLRDS
ncbi:hypothetical protein ACHAWF_000044, partial [Thalassiosira exigua]